MPAFAKPRGTLDEIVSRRTVSGMSWTRADGNESHEYYSGMLLHRPTQGKYADWRGSEFIAIDPGPIEKAGLTITQRGNTVTVTGGWYTLTIDSRALTFHAEYIDDVMDDGVSSEVTKTLLNQTFNPASAFEVNGWRIMLRDAVEGLDLECVCKENGWRVYKRVHETGPHEIVWQETWRTVDTLARLEQFGHGRRAFDSSVGLRAAPTHPLGLLAEMSFVKSPVTDAGRFRQCTLTETITGKTVPAGSDRTIQGPFTRDATYPIIINDP